MNLNIENPDLKIKSFSSTSQEKENIKNIYSEIIKEGKVLEINKEKDQKYDQLKGNLNKHRNNFSNFEKRSIPATLKNVKKEQRRIRRQADSGEGVTVRFKRFNKDSEFTEELNILKKINKIKKHEKEAVLEFYKSYLKAINQKNELLDKLEKIDSEIVKKSRKSKRNTNGLQSNVDYLEKMDLNDPKRLIIDLSKNNIPPKTLLQENEWNLMGNQFKELEKKIEGWNSTFEAASCNLTIGLLSIFVGSSACELNIHLWRGDQDTLQRAVDFQALLKLLKDMKRRVPTFRIEHEQKLK